MSAIEEVKERADIIEIVGETVKLRKSGKNYTGLCPFHPNTRTPAFAVFPDSQTWRCFGACNEGGDVFSFLMKKEGWDFPETLRYLANRYGIELKPLTPEREEAEEEQQRLREVLEAAAAFFRHQLLNSPAGEEVLKYLKGRGLTEDTLEAFEVGYAPKSWEALITHLAEREFSQEDMMSAGVVSERDGGGIYDRFRNRIMIPIRDSRGRMVGFGARIVDPDDVPKFLNSPQTALFDKGRLLYGLDKARKAIRSMDHSVVVEGYMDVMALHQAGFDNAVSPMGTALTEHHIRTLKRYSRKIVLALDPDEAGEKAVLKGLTVALDEARSEGPDVRGLVRSEGRLDAELRVASMPDGLDPDEIVDRDREQWVELMQSASPIVSYLIDTSIEGQDVDDPKIKWEIARRVMPVVEAVGNQVEREAYRQLLARRLKVDERALIDWRPKVQRRRGGAQTTEAKQAPEVSRVDNPQARFCLGVLLSDPEILYRVDRELQELKLDRLSPDDFLGTDRQELLRRVRASLTQDEVEPLEHWQRELSPALDQTAQSLMTEVAGLELKSPKVMDEILARFLDLRKRNLEAKLVQLRFQIEAEQENLSSGESDDKEAIWYHTREVQKLSAQKMGLDRALARRGGSTKPSLLTQEW
jgi:DNA primase